MPSAGMTGSVFYDLEVPDFRKEKLMMGGLLLASASGQQTPSIQPDHGARESDARRRHEPARVLAARSPRALHGDLRQHRIDAGTARRHCRAHALGETGREAFAVRDELENGGVAPKKPWDIYGYSKEIALKDIAPGRYALRVEAQVRGNIGDAKPVARETLITVVP